MGKVGRLAKVHYAEALRSDLPQNCVFLRTKLSSSAHEGFFRKLLIPITKILSISYNDST
jgi:hypothetical protein